MDHAQTSSRLEQIIVVGLPAVMAGAALAHGAVEAWSVLLFELGLTGLLFLWALKAWQERTLVCHVPQTVWPVLALFALGLLQSVSWRGADGFSKSLSLDVEATRRVTLLLVLLAGGACLASNFLVMRTRMEKLARGISLFGLGLALFSIAQYFTWNQRFYWLRWTSSYAPFGPFVNRNHFAGYMELLLPWPLVMVLLRRGHWQEQLFYGVAAAWIGISAILSLSRGGMLSIGAELVLLAWLSSRLVRTQKAQGARTNRKVDAMRLGAFVALLAVIIGGVIWFDGQRVRNRMMTGHETESATTLPAQTFAESRLANWRDAWAVFLAHPFTGAGLGAYQTASTVYGQDKHLGQFVIAHAHNDYLQSLTDGGIVGGAIAVWFLLALVRAARRGLRVAEPFWRAMSLACLTGIFGMLVHSLFDYNLQLPSHALVFMSSAAILWQIGAANNKRVTTHLSSPVQPTVDAGEPQRTLR